MLRKFGEKIIPTGILVPVISDGMEVNRTREIPMAHIIEVDSPKGMGDEPVTLVLETAAGYLGHRVAGRPSKSQVQPPTQIDSHNSK